MTVTKDGVRSALEETLKARGIDPNSIPTAQMAVGCDKMASEANRVLGGPARA